MFPSVTPFPVPRNTSVFSVDVEDWFHIMDLPSAPRLEQWGEQPSLVERNFFALLDQLDARKVISTCFFLGWAAERYPNMVREATARGHEVASHGYGHDLVYEMSPDAFLADITRAKTLIEDIAGQPVQGYRAPAFSVTAQTPWFFDRLAQAGYRYSSSVFPGGRVHGGMRTFTTAPCVVDTPHGPICEFPISVTPIFGIPRCFFGGGYLRLSPYPVIKWFGRRVLADGRPLVFYLHPREIDPAHPRFDTPLIRRIKLYSGLRTTSTKLDHIFRDFSFVPFAALLQGAHPGAD